MRASFWVQTRSVSSSSPTAVTAFVALVAMLSVVGVAGSPASAEAKAVADDEVTPPPPPPERTKDELLAEEIAYDLLRDEKCTGDCCVSTGQKVIMGAGSIAVFLILFFLLVRLVERAFIRRESSPLLGRHSGISMALFFGGLGMLAIFYLVGGCWHMSYLWWGLFVGAAWLLHGAYTLLAVRGR